MSTQEHMRQDAESYGAERLVRDIVSYPPRWVTIGIINRCNNRCVFCSYHSRDARGGKSRVYNLPYAMPVERFRQQVDFFHAGRVPRIHICATGEPFLHNGIMDMIDHIITRYGKASFQSNFHPAVMRRGNYLEKIIERKNAISHIVTDLHAGDATRFADIKKGSSLPDLLSTLRLFSAHGIPIIGSCILSRSNYTALPGIIDTLAAHGITMQLNIVGLFPHMFNEFTSLNNTYRTSDTHITQCLHAMRAAGERHGITVTLPKPHDDPSGRCDVFWQKLQIWPVAGADENRYDENLIPHACNAVVLGNMNSLGYVSDYATVMDLWNNKTIVGIRRRILAGEYPDKYCATCSCGVNLHPAP